MRDAAVDPAARCIQQSRQPQQDAVVQFWLASANPEFRQAADAAIAGHCARFAAWLVAESTVIANTVHPPTVGERTWGWAQASFIAFRADRPSGEALRHWRGHHTSVAIATQATFEYVQNAILCPLTDGAPAYDAFVEECFPPAAMSDPAAFFDAPGDAAKLSANVEAMMASCRAFLDFDRNDIIPTSQFDFSSDIAFRSPQ